MTTRIFHIILLSVIFTGFLYSQTYIYAGPHFSYTPWKIENQLRYVTLRPPADYSPVPSVVRYIEENRSSLWNYGLLIKEDKINNMGESEIEYGLLIETSFLLQPADFVNSILGGPGAFYSYGVSDNSKFSLGGFIYVNYLWGNIGSVGDVGGDYHFEAPDGKIYYTGANIKVTKVSLGVDLLAGFELLLSEDIGIRIDGGYRMTGKIDEWNYKISDDNQSSELPGEGFSENPPVLDLSGGIVRFTILYGIEL